MYVTYFPSKIKLFMYCRNKNSTNHTQHKAGPDQSITQPPPLRRKLVVSRPSSPKKQSKPFFLVPCLFPWHTACHATAGQTPNHEGSSPVRFIPSHTFFPSLYLAPPASRLSPINKSMHGAPPAPYGVSFVRLYPGTEPATAVNTPTPKKTFSVPSHALSTRDGARYTSSNGPLPRGSLPYGPRMGLITIPCVRALRGAPTAPRQTAASGGDCCHPPSGRHKTRGK